MNAKTLFAATVAVSALSLVGTVAIAAEASGSLTRTEVRAQAAAAGNVARGELSGADSFQPSAASPVRRSEVLAALTSDRAAHPYDHVGERDGLSTPVGYAAPSTLARAEVKADVRHAIADGTLLRNGEGDNGSYTSNATSSRAARQHLALASR